MHAGKRCRKLTEQGDEVFIDFEGGTTATADMVVGCDGIHSAVRAQFTTDNPEYSGRIAYRGLVPTSEIEDWWGFDTYSATWLGKNRHFLCFPVSKSTKLNIVAFVAEEEENLGGLRESWTTVGRREDIFEAFRDFEERVQKLIRLMPDDPSKWKLNDRVPLDKWVYRGGKVVLLGDAAHAMLPHQGAGAGQAIEDGYILARALHDYFQSSADSLENWTYLYQAVRLPRAQRVQRTSRDAVEIYHAQADIMKDLTFEQCVPEIHKRVIDRMRWIWHDNLDEEYDQTVKDCKHAGVLR